MQNLWRLTLVVGLAFAASLSASAQTVRVTTWNLEWFPSGSPASASSQVESNRIFTAAATLKEINPDVILLQEIRDLDTCEKLSAALAPLRYKVAVCSRFKDEFGAGLGRQQVAILAKLPAVTVFSDRWKTFGTVDPPRGFSFAAFQFDHATIGFYSVHLKSNLTKGDTARQTQLNILKRELAAEQIIAHGKRIGALLTNKLSAIVVGGDFNTNPDQDNFVSERTLTLFFDEGYRSGFEGIPLSERVTHPGKGSYPNATFDYLFVNRVVARKPILTSSSLSDHRPVTREIVLPSPSQQ